MNALVLHNARLVLREPGPALSRILSSLALMVLIRPLIQATEPGPGGTIRAVLLPLLLFSMLGVSVVANALLGERIWHTLDRLRATPLRATSRSPRRNRLAAPLGSPSDRTGRVPAAVPSLV